MPNRRNLDLVLGRPGLRIVLRMMDGLPSISFLSPLRPKLSSCGCNVLPKLKVPEAKTLPKKRREGFFHPRQNRWIRLTSLSSQKKGRRRNWKAETVHCILNKMGIGKRIEANNNNVQSNSGVTGDLGLSTSPCSSPERQAPCPAPRGRIIYKTPTVTLAREQPLI